MAEQFSNNAITTLNGGIDNSVTSLTVASATGFPTSGNFRIIVKAEGANSDEIMTVTAVSGTTFTVTRASEPTAGVQSASAHASGALVAHILTTASITGLSGIIASKVWAPVGDTDANTGSSSPTDINATEVIITFVTPPSGNVTVEILGGFGITSGYNSYLQLREGTTPIQSWCMFSGGTQFAYRTMKSVVTGLTPGSSHTYKYAHYTNGGGAAHLYVGSGTTPNYYPMYIEVKNTP